MLNFIKEFIEFIQLKQQRRTACQRFVVQQAILRYFEDLQAAKGTVELPPFILAVDAMKELKTPKQINRMYKKLEMAGLV